MEQTFQSVKHYHGEVGRPIRRGDITTTKLLGIGGNSKGVIPMNVRDTVQNQRSHLPTSEPHPQLPYNTNWLRRKEQYTRAKGKSRDLRCAQCVDYSNLHDQVGQILQLHKRSD